METTIQVVAVMAGGVALLYLTKTGVARTLRIVSNAIWAASFALEALTAGIAAAVRDAQREYSRQYETQRDGLERLGSGNA